MQIIVDEEVNKTRLDIFLCEKMPEFSRSKIKTLIESDKILVNGKKVKAGYELKAGDEINVDDIPTESKELLAQDIPIDIVYEDADLAVINKGQGMVVHPGSGNWDNTLVNALMFHIKDLSGINGEIRPGIVHRLDKDTSGLLVIAKNDTAHKELARQIETKEFRRIYTALLEGRLKTESGVVDTYLKRSDKDRKKIAIAKAGEGKRAISHYTVLQIFDKYTLVQFELKTGRTHQIRVHAQNLGFPVVGDATYGKAKQDFRLQGQLLHSSSIEFIHPTSGKLLKFESELPRYFSEILRKIGNAHI